MSEPELFDVIELLVELTLVQDKSWKSGQEKGFMELLATNETPWMRLL